MNRDIRIVTYVNKADYKKLMKLMKNRNCCEAELIREIIKSYIYG